MEATIQVLILVGLLFVFGKLRMEWKIWSAERRLFERMQKRDYFSEASFV
jgi:hypothetical protein